MRIIEKKMIAAIIAGNSFTLDSTEVTARSVSHDCEVLLHGHCIATLGFNSEDTKLPAWINYSACGYNTRTTRSRLNALFNAFGKSPRDGVRTQRGAMKRTQDGTEYEMESTAHYCYFIK